MSLTFHGHGEGVGGGAVAVGRPALVLAVVRQLHAAEAEVMFVVGHLGAGLLQSAVLLLPLHRRSRPADTETPGLHRDQRPETGQVANNATAVATLH